MDRGASRAIVHRVAESWSPLNNQHFHFHPQMTGESIFLFVCFFYLAVSGLSMGSVAPWPVGSHCLDQGLNPCPLYWKADSQPLDHQ